MKQRIADILLKVDKPARYCGGEFNTPEMKRNAKLNFLMCFPDVYEVAHSNLGIKILYYMLNARLDTKCETCYAPWHDLAEQLKQNSIDLFSLETQTPIKEFDVIGFSMQYEMSYTNVLYMLELGNIPLFRNERNESHPIIVAGGPCVINPSPLVDFIDVFSIGDGEDAINQLAETVVYCKDNNFSRRKTLEEISKINGMYVPNVNTTARRAVVDNLDTAFYPTKIQIPNVEAVHNRAVLEIFRGCTRGCRFCQAGMIYRPVRERKVETLKKYAKELIINNGFEEISLSSLSTCDYPNLKELLRAIKPVCDEYNVNVSLPSTRIDSFESEYVSKARLSSLTFAPEAGTQRMRDVINKNVTEEDLFRSLKYAFERGYSSVKLYFMIGLPTETDEDIDGIIQLAKKIKQFYKANATSKKPLSLSISTSTFVPKPFTPFQWEAQISISETERKQFYLKDALRPLGIKYSYHDSRISRIEACLARGDEKLGKVIYKAYKNGCVFDSWNDFFDYQKWVDAFLSENLTIDEYASKIDTNKTLPWDNIEAGVSKEFLLLEREKAYKGILTDDCRNGCRNCGINASFKSSFNANCKGGAGS